MLKRAAHGSTYYPSNARQGAALKYKQRKSANRSYKKTKYGKFTPYFTPSRTARSYPVAGYKKRRYNKYRSRFAASSAVVAAPRLAAQLARLKSPCISKWLQLALDPFGETVDACNPFTFPFMAERLFVYKRGNIATTANFNAAGNAYFVFSPMRMAGNDGTSPLFGGDALITASTNLSAYPTLGSTWYSNSPFAAAEISSSGETVTQAAIVAAGFRFRYTGKAESRAGTVSIYEDPSHRDLLSTTNVTFDDLRGQDAMQTYPVTSDWTTVVWSGPSKSEEVNWIASLSVTSAPHCFAFAFEGLGVDPDRDAQHFQLELCLHFEAVGNAIRHARRSEQDSTAQDWLTRWKNLLQSAPSVNTDKINKYVCGFFLHFSQSCSYFSSCACCTCCFYCAYCACR